MKTYLIYLSDEPHQPIKGSWKNKTEARQAAKLYIKQWGLDATQEEKRLTYKGKDRFEAYKAFEKQIALYPGAEIIDYRKKK